MYREGEESTRGRRAQDNTGLMSNGSKTIDHCAAFDDMTEVIDTIQTQVTRGWQACPPSSDNPIDRDANTVPQQPNTKAFLDEVEVS